MSDRRFPLQGGPSIPWDVIAPFEAQAVENHDQSLQRLAERGGLSPGEFWCVMNSLKLPHSNWKASGVEEKGLALANEICEKHSASQERIADLEQQLADLQTHLDIANTDRVATEAIRSIRSASGYPKVDTVKVIFSTGKEIIFTQDMIRQGELLRMLEIQPPAAKEGE